MTKSEEVLDSIRERDKMPIGMAFSVKQILEAMEYANRDIKIGEIFTIEGKKYLATIPKQESMEHLKMANGHGHIISPLTDI